MSILLLGVMARMVMGNFNHHVPIWYFSACCGLVLLLLLGRRPRAQPRGALGRIRRGHRPVQLRQPRGAVHPREVQGGQERIRDPQPGGGLRAGKLLRNQKQDVQEHCQLLAWDKSSESNANMQSKIPKKIPIYQDIYRVTTDQSC